MKLKLRKKDDTTTIIENDALALEAVLDDGFDPNNFDPNKLAPYEIYEPIDYRDGPEGFITWCEDMVCIPVYPEGSDIAIWVPISELSSDIHPRSGKSYDYIWQQQKEVMRQALRMVFGRFIYRLIILSWMRGEGKSLLACLIQLWKFFNWTKQTIVLGANSKDQIRFVHYDTMRDIIRNSPKLLHIVGDKNIQEKEIRLRDASNNVTSVIRPISSFSGIVSNITGYTFSEIFDMNNPTFFTQLDGSIRNIPNALGVIDSTVSPKTHVLYKMYKAFMDNETKGLYFSYRCSRDAKVEDYWNPNMDQQQLDDYKAKFPIGDFDKYFRNVWGSDIEQVFTQSMTYATNVVGIDGRPTPPSVYMPLVERRQQLVDTIEHFAKQRSHLTFDRDIAEIASITSRLVWTENYYRLRDAYNNPCMATMDDLNALSELFDTDWVILFGIDRADPLKTNRTAARTITVVVAKGLRGSRSNPNVVDGNPQYIYVLLDLRHLGTSLLSDIKEAIIDAHGEFDGIDAICGERWGIWDIVPWCEEQGIRCELIHPSYDKQKGAFSEIHGAFKTGRFKSPPIVVPGSKSENILKEEAEAFVHDSDRRWFGSPEKGEKYGIQDDCMFSLAWCVHGGREFTSVDFRERGKGHFFGTMVQSTGMLAASQ